MASWYVCVYLSRDYDGEFCLFVIMSLYRLPRSLVGSPLRPGDDILEINGVAIVDQDQKEVSHVLYYISYEIRKLYNACWQEAVEHWFSQMLYIELLAYNVAGY